MNKISVYLKISRQQLPLVVLFIIGLGILWKAINFYEVDNDFAGSAMLAFSALMFIMSIFPNLESIQLFGLSAKIREKKFELDTLIEDTNQIRSNLEAFSLTASCAAGHALSACALQRMVPSGALRKRIEELRNALNTLKIDKGKQEEAFAPVHELEVMWRLNELKENACDYIIKRAEDSPELKDALFTKTAANGRRVYCSDVAQEQLIDGKFTKGYNYPDIYKAPDQFKEELRTILQGFDEIYEDTMKDIGDKFSKFEKYCQTYSKNPEVVTQDSPPLSSF